jgi:hypothetical protein
MKTALITIGLFIVLVCGFVGVTYLYGNNLAVNYESELRKTKADTKQYYAQYVNRVQGIAKVPAMYVDDLSRLTSEALSGRYGQDGIDALFVMIQEKNPELPNEMYTKIQRTIESGTNAISNKQKRMIEVRENYYGDTLRPYKGFAINFAGFPTIDFDDYEALSNEKTNETFESGIDNGVEF